MQHCVACGSLGKPCNEIGAVSARIVTFLSEPSLLYG